MKNTPLKLPEKTASGIIRAAGLLIRLSFIDNISGRKRRRSSSLPITRVANLVSYPATYEYTQFSNNTIVERSRERRRCGCRGDIFDEEESRGNRRVVHRSALRAVRHSGIRVRCFASAGVMPAGAHGGAVEGAESAIAYGSVNAADTGKLGHIGCIKKAGQRRVRKKSATGSKTHIRKRGGESEKGKMPCQIKKSCRRRNLFHGNRMN